VNIAGLYSKTVATGELPEFSKVVREELPDDTYDVEVVNIAGSYSTTVATGELP
jgi:hypothetical protein